MVNYYGKCRCGNVNVTLYLPQTLDKYSPRKCNCDFCMLRGVLYLSDSDGCLYIGYRQSLEIQKQGSNQASFLTCGCCRTVVAASVSIGDKLIGSLNSALLADSTLLKAPVEVSPKLLSIKEKTDRWKKTWFYIEMCPHHSSV